MNQCAFANNCGVPFGALLDYAGLAVAPLRQVVGRLPVRCNSCAGFMNIHCKVRQVGRVVPAEATSAANAVERPAPCSAAVTLQVWRVPSTYFAEQRRFPRGDAGT